MLKIGDKVLIKHGMFLNYNGTVEHVFDYNNAKRYTVSVYKGKNISEKYITTGVEGDFEKIN